MPSRTVVAAVVAAAVAAAVLVAFLASPAVAQDRDPFQAVNDAQALRARQMAGVQRAENRTLDPFAAEHPADAPAAAPAKPAAPPRKSGGGFPAWGWAVLGAAAVGFVVLRIRGGRR